MIHHLKTLPEYFQPVIEGRKPFEIRENDRNFKCGDLVILEEFIKTEHIPECSHYQEYINYYDEETDDDCPHYDCAECQARCQKCHDYINHVYTGRTCSVRIKDIFDISFLLPNYVAFTFEIRSIRK